MIRRLGSDARVGGALALLALCAIALPGLAKAAGTLRFHKIVIRDRPTGLDAYTMLVPAGWTGGGRVIWDLSRTIAPSQIIVHLTKPKGTEDLSILPPLMFSWSPLYERYSAQIGGGFQGAVIMRPVDGPVAAIRAVVIPRYMRPIASSYTILQSQELPRLAAAYAPMYIHPGQPSGIVRAGRMRIQYAAGGRNVEAEIRCVFLYSQGPSGVIWAVDQINIFRADNGKLDAAALKMELSVLSLEPTPRFSDANSQVTSMLVQRFYTNQQALMAQVAIRERAQQQISNEIMQGWEARQQATSKAIENWDLNVIRGVTNRTNPFTGEVAQVPNDYNHVWVNANGDYIYSNSESFNPNGQSNVQWQEMPPAK
jgi:hypothetical protein